MPKTHFYRQCYTKVLCSFCCFKNCRRLEWFDSGRRKGRICSWQEIQEIIYSLLDRPMHTGNEILTQFFSRELARKSMFRVALDLCTLFGLNGNHFLIQPALLLTRIQKVCAKLALSLQSFEHWTINLIQGESVCIPSSYLKM